MPTLDRPPMGKSTLVQVNDESDGNNDRTGVVLGVPFKSRAGDWWVPVQLFGDGEQPACYLCANLTVLAKRVSLGSNGKTK